MTERSTKPSAWLLGAAGAAVIAAAVGAYYVGLFPNLAPGQKGPAAAPPVANAPAAPAAPAGTSSAPIQSANVPLISVAPPADPNAPGVAPAATVAVPGAAQPATAPVVPAAQQPAQAAVPAAGQPAVPGAAVKPGTPPAVAPTPIAAAPAAPAPGASTLVLTATEDSWITIQPPGKKALVSRMLKAGSTETFEVPGPALLIVGKPANVKATLQGAPLELPSVPGGTISRVNINR